LQQNNSICNKSIAREQYSIKETVGNYFFLYQYMLRTMLCELPKMFKKFPEHFIFFVFYILLSIHDNKRDLSRESMQVCNYAITANYASFVKILIR